MKQKLFIFLLAILTGTGTLFAASGTCGTNLTWNLTDSVLTISGTGAMTNYSSSSSNRAPWYSSRTSITSVLINAGVTSIGNYAFYNCSNMTSVTIPNSVTSIGMSAFYECSSLTSVNISDIAAWCAISFGSDYANPLYYAHNLYLNGSLVTDLVIPNSVTTIGSSAFSGCSSLTSVTIPNSVTTIGSSAFSGCRSLISLTIPNSVTSIGGSAFYECNSLTSVEIPNSVTSIGSSAFRSCSSLTSVTIGNSVTSIGGSAFRSCSSLTNITIPNAITWISESCFRNCTSLTSVYIPDNVTGIEVFAFKNCSSLASVHIGSNVNTLGYDVFNGTALYNNVNNWEDGILYIDDWLYEAKNGNIPVAYTIREGTRGIADNAFINCSRLTSVVIPSSVHYINGQAFLNCSGLTSVEFKEKASDSPTTIIEYAAFKNCTNLVSIYALSTTPPIISYNTFDRISPKAVVYVSFGSINTYQNADYWKDLNIQGPSISQEIMNLSTSCTIRYDVEGIELQSIGISGGEQQAGNTLEYIGLEPESEYKDIPVVLTSNTGETETVNVSFTTTSLELTTKAAKPVSSSTAILLAETNMSDAEVSCGFEWKRENAPDAMEGTKVFCPVASDQMAGRLKNLRDDVYYKYRAFYQSAAGNMYYGDWQYIFTGDVAVEFDPILYTYAPVAVREREATISGYALAGSEDFDDQGLEYWAESRVEGLSDQVPNTNGAPRRMLAGLNEHFYVPASGIKMTVTLTDLDEGTVYKYRAYGKVGNQYYYGSEQTFTTKGVYEEDAPTAIDQVPSDQVQGPKATKILRDSQIYILRGEKVYSITGAGLK